MPSDPIELAPHEVGPWSTGYDAALIAHATEMVAFSNNDRIKYVEPKDEDEYAEGVARCAKYATMAANAKILALRERTPKVVGETDPLNLDKRGLYGPITPEGFTPLPTDPAPPLSPDVARAILSPLVAEGVWVVNNADCFALAVNRSRRIFISFRGVEIDRGDKKWATVASRSEFAAFLGCDAKGRDEPLTPERAAEILDAHPKWHKCVHMAGMARAWKFGTRCIIIDGAAIRYTPHEFNCRYQPITTEPELRAFCEGRGA